MTETTTAIARIGINDQAITRSFDIANQIKVYRTILVDGGVSAAMADQMCFRLNERILSERFTPPTQNVVVRVDDEQ